MEWQDPPENKWDTIARELQDNPGRWAKLEERPAYMDSIKKGKLKAFRPVGAYEARTARGALFVRYTGGKK